MNFAIGGQDLSGITTCYNDFLSTRSEGNPSVGMIRVFACTTIPLCMFPLSKLSSRYDFCLKNQGSPMALLQISVG